MSCSTATPEMTPAQLADQWSDQLELLPRHLACYRPPARQRLRSAPPVRRPLGQMTLPLPAPTRGQRALALFQEGYPLPLIAARMKMSQGDVAGIIMREHERSSRPRAERLPLARLQRMVAEWETRGPDNTLAALARLAGFKDLSHFKRTMGLKATTASHKNGVVYPSRIHTTVPLRDADRIVIALGRTLADLDE